MRTVSRRSRRSRGDEKGRGVKGKGESYFWFLSRKSNLRSLTRKELQMHGRQHTGVSIYEARTGTREKDERSCWSDGEAAVETADGETGMRQRGRDKEKERRRERKRDEDLKKEDAAERASTRKLNDHGSFATPSPIIPRAKTRIFHPLSGPSP